MIKTLSIDGKPVVGIYEVVVDTEAELEDLSELNYVQTGSTALCIENSKRYMLSGSGVWTEVNFKRGGGGGDEPVGTITITQNGVVNVKAYASADVQVENSYTASDEGKVVSSGALVGQTSRDISANGTVDTTLNSQVVVNVPIPSYTTSAFTVSQNGVYSVPSGVDGYNPVTVNVSGGGNYDNFKIAARTMSGSIYDTELSMIGSSTFYYNSCVTGVEMTSVTSVNYNAFNGCSNLMEASFPKCTFVGGATFVSCSKLSEIYFPMTTTLGPSAFKNCSSLTSISFPICTSLSSETFFNCQNLETAYLPEILSMTYRAFSSCYKLYSINAPKITSIDAGAFYQCSMLTSAHFSLVKTIGINAFYRCINLKTASFPMCSSMWSGAFDQCNALESLYLLSTSVTPIAGTTLNNTPISNSSYLGYFGSVFVPASLVDAYKSATNWSKYADRITAYEE